MANKGIWNVLFTAFESETPKGDILRVSAIENNKGKFVDVRTFYHEGDGTLQPGKGVLISPHDAQRVAEAISTASAKL
jgi:hypothetical protein